MMKFNSALALILLVSLVAAFDKPHRAALDALRKAEPTVNWDEKSTVIADVECDAIPKTLVVGYEPNKVWLGVVHDAKEGVKATAESYSFPVGKNSQDSFCAVPVHIETAPIDCDTEDGPLAGCKPVKGCRDFSLVDDSCDSFHFYWDSVHRRLV